MCGELDTGIFGSCSEMLRAVLLSGRSSSVSIIVCETRSYCLARSCGVLFSRGSLLLALRNIADSELDGKANEQDLKHMEADGQLFKNNQKI